jgi:hypothetical protein
LSPLEPDRHLARALARLDVDHTGTTTNGAIFRIYLVLSTAHVNVDLFVLSAERARERRLPRFAPLSNFVRHGFRAGLMIAAAKEEPVGCRMPGFWY